MPPEHSEEARETGGNRVEQLANNFASAVLMPVPVLDRFGDWSDLRDGELPARLNAVADELQVTASALKWRLVALDRLKPAVARTVSDAALRNNGRRRAGRRRCRLLFSKPFMEVIALAVDEGRVSARRAAGLLDLTVEDLADCSRRTGSNPRSICEGRWRVTPAPSSSTQTPSWRASGSGAWRALAGGYGVETVEDCVTETQTGYQRRRPEQQIDAAQLRASLAAVHPVERCGTRRGGGSSALTSRWTSARDPYGRMR